MSEGSQRFWVELEQEHKQRSCATNATDNNTNAPLRAPSPGNLVAPPPPPPPPSLGKAAARHSQLPGTNMNSATAQQGAQEAGNDAQTATATQVCASTRPAHVSAKASATPSQAGELKAVLERSARSREAGVDAEVEADGDEGRQSVSRSNRYGVCKSNAPKSPSARFCAMPASRVWLKSLCARGYRLASGMMLITLALLSLGRAASSDDDGSLGLAEHVVANSPEGDARAALEAFTAFSEKQQMGMALGLEKGALIESAVQQGLPASGPAVVFEAGCHAGDGTLSAVLALQERKGSTIISTESNQLWLDATKKVMGHATKGMDIRHFPKMLPDAADFGEFLESLWKDHGISHFDSVIFDHDEHLFLPYLKIILEKDFLRTGGTVQIDNVKRKAEQLQTYMDFVSSEAGNGLKTEVKEVQRPYPDAIAISTWLGQEKETEL